MALSPECFATNTFFISFKNGVSISGIKVLYKFKYFVYFNFFFSLYKNITKCIKNYIFMLFPTKTQSNINTTS